MSIKLNGNVNNSGNISFIITQSTDITENSFLNVSTIGGINIQDTGYDSRDGSFFLFGTIVSAADGNSYVGSRDLVLIKFNNQNQIQWSRNYNITDTGAAFGFAGGIDVDSNGNVYAVGYTDGTPANMGLVTKFDELGNTVWDRVVRNFTIANSINTVTVLNSGEIIIGGETVLSAYGTLGNDDIFLMSISANASLNWVRAYGNINGDSVNKVMGDTTNNIVMVGNYAGTNTFGNIDGFVARVNRSDGVLTTFRGLGGTASDDIFNVYVDSSNSPFIVGRTASPPTINPTDLLLCRLSSDLTTVVWGRRVGTSLVASGINVNGLGISETVSGNLIITGHLSSLSVGVRYGLVFLFDKSGNIIQQRQIYVGGENLTIRSVSVLGNQIIFALNVGAAGNTVLVFNYDIDEFFSLPLGAYTDFDLSDQGFTVNAYTPGNVVRTINQETRAIGYEVPSGLFTIEYNNTTINVVNNT